MFSAWKRKSLYALLSLLIAVALYAIIIKLSAQCERSVSVMEMEDDRPILIIDPGHGGDDGGAVSADGLVESGVNLDIAQRLNGLCGFLGIRSAMSREEESLDYPAEMDTIAKRKRWDTRQRTDFINSFGNAVLLSIHQNNFPDSRRRGPQAFYGAVPGGRELALLIHDNMTSNLYPDSRRVASPVPKEVYIMSNVRCPAVLVECAFLSNPEDCALLRQDRYRTKIAAILLTSYLQYTEDKDESQNDFLLH